VRRSSSRGLGGGGAGDVLVVKKGRGGREVGLDASRSIISAEF
jgi:hypothetical protein